MHIAHRLKDNEKRQEMIETVRAQIQAIGYAIFVRSCSSVTDENLNDRLGNDAYLGRLLDVAKVSYLQRRLKQ